MCDDSDEAPRELTIDMIVDVDTLMKRGRIKGPRGSWFEFKPDGTYTVIFPDGTRHNAEDVYFVT